MIAILFAGSTAFAGPVEPVYETTFEDAQTGDNSFIADDGKRYWTIDSLADSYQNDFYERPTVQTYQVRTLSGGEQRFAANEYFENLDITRARAGYDSNYLYLAIDLYGRDKSTDNGVDTPEGLNYRYGVRLSAAAEDGGGGFAFWVTQPESTHGTTYGLLKNTGYFDTNGDVGGTGLSVTKQDLFSESLDNGYETDIIVDGKLLSNGTDVFWSRIRPTDNTVVEFAINYGALGFTQAQLQDLDSLIFEAFKGGPNDPRKYLWNDEYNHLEAGSPYRATSGDLSKSEFGTQGLVNIYELDTLHGGPIGIPMIPVPAALPGGLLLLGCLAMRRLHRRTHA